MKEIHVEDEDGDSPGTPSQKGPEADLRSKQPMKEKHESEVWIGSTAGDSKGQSSAPGPDEGRTDEANHLRKEGNQRQNKNSCTDPKNESGGNSKEYTNPISTEDPEGQHAEPERGNIINSTKQMDPNTCITRDNKGPAFCTETGNDHGSGDNKEHRPGINTQNDKVITQQTYSSDSESFGKQQTEIMKRKSGELSENNTESSIHCKLDAPNFASKSTSNAGSTTVDGSNTRYNAGNISVNSTNEAGGYETHFEQLEDTTGHNKNIPAPKPEAADGGNDLNVPVATDRGPEDPNDDKKNTEAGVHDRMTDDPDRNNKTSNAVTVDIEDDNIDHNDKNGESDFSDLDNEDDNSNAASSSAVAETFDLQSEHFATVENPDEIGDLIDKARDIKIDKMEVIMWNNAENHKHGSTYVFKQRENKEEEERLQSTHHDDANKSPHPGNYKMKGNSKDSDSEYIYISKYCFDKISEQGDFKKELEKNKAVHSVRSFKQHYHYSDVVRLELVPKLTRKCTQKDVEAVADTYKLILKKGKDSLSIQRMSNEADHPGENSGSGQDEELLPHSQIVLKNTKTQSTQTTEGETDASQNNRGGEQRLDTLVPMRLELSKKHSDTNSQHDENKSESGTETNGVKDISDQSIRSSERETDVLQNDRKMSLEKLQENNNLELEKETPAKEKSMAAKEDEYWGTADCLLVEQKVYDKIVKDNSSMLDNMKKKYNADIVEKRVINEEGKFVLFFTKNFQNTSVSQEDEMLQKCHSLVKILCPDKSNAAEPMEVHQVAVGDEPEGTQEGITHLASTEDHKGQNPDIDTPHDGCSADQTRLSSTESNQRPELDPKQCKLDALYNRYYKTSSDSSSPAELTTKISSTPESKEDKSKLVNLVNVNEASKDATKVQNKQPDNAGDDKKIFENSKHDAASEDGDGNNGNMDNDVRGDCDLDESNGENKSKDNNSNVTAMGGVDNDRPVTNHQDLETEKKSDVVRELEELTSNLGLGNGKKMEVKNENIDEKCGGNDALKCYFRREIKKQTDKFGASPEIDHESMAGLGAKSSMQPTGRGIVHGNYNAQGQRFNQNPWNSHRGNMSSPGNNQQQTAAATKDMQGRENKTKLGSNQNAWSETRMYSSSPGSYQHQASAATARAGNQMNPRLEGQSNNIDDDCCICLDTIKVPKVLPCKHRYCKDCIDQHEKISGPKCPQCFVPFGKIKGNQPPGTCDSTYSADCCICMDTIKIPKVLPCKHSFCKDCIDQHEKIFGPKCPQCFVPHGKIKGNQPSLSRQWQNIEGKGSYGSNARRVQGSSESAQGAKTMLCSTPGQNNRQAVVAVPRHLSHMNPKSENYSIDIDDDCCICIDKPKNPKVLPCKHRYCKDCIDQHEKISGPKCPQCFVPFGKIKGNQPPGTCTITTDRYINLPGYGRCGSIKIQYCISSGIQTDRHPNPGKPYYSIFRTGYLPNNDEGRDVANLLKKAFDERHIFTVGRSVTNNRDDCVVWNDIHHKTVISGSPCGYPDPDYLKRVREELRAKGIVSKEGDKKFAKK